MEEVQLTQFLVQASSLLIVVPVPGAGILALMPALLAWL